MAVRKYTVSKNSDVEWVLIELTEILLFLETHIDSMGVFPKLFIRDTSYVSKEDNLWIHVDIFIEWIFIQYMCMTKCLYICLRKCWTDEFGNMIWGNYQNKNLRE